MAVIANISQRTTERELATLQKNGIIRFEGNARNGHWCFLSRQIDAPKDAPKGDPKDGTKDGPKDGTK